MQHAAAVMCILYLDNQVIVSLANGEPVVYQWEAGEAGLETSKGCFWDPQNSKCLSLGSPGILITKMVAVAGKLWCGCHSQVIVLSTPPWHKSGAGLDDLQRSLPTPGLLGACDPVFVGIVQ
ncbi:rho guanine nucleotide exchange factor 17-like isoform X3 [Melanerpes formicivorus]|uniref:rho guanine nucleotide exchange factor 17-like isoform X1 n=2 Tax=Melanerpes formicivorus TaxID=211600 RepID=UPI00358EE17D